MFLGFQADLELVRDLDHGRGRKDRSQFIREAIAKKLDGQGIRMREDLIHAPPRAARVEVNYTNGRSGKGKKK